MAHVDVPDGGDDDENNGGDALVGALLDAYVRHEHNLPDVERRHGEPEQQVHRLRRGSKKEERRCGRGAVRPMRWMMRNGTVVAWPAATTTTTTTEGGVGRQAIRTPKRTLRGTLQRTAGHEVERNIHASRQACPSRKKLPPQNSLPSGFSRKCATHSDENHLYAPRVSACRRRSRYHTIY